MTKWGYIRLISERGSDCRQDTVLRLLEWCDKPSTAAVTLEEARQFWEKLLQAPEETDLTAP